MKKLEKTSLDINVFTGIFALLKLLGVVDWSWWWVFSPTLLTLAVVALGYVSVLLAYTKALKK